MLLHGDQVEQVAVRLKLHQHVDVGVHPAGTARPRAEDADAKHAHAAQGRHLGANGAKERSEVSRGVRAHDQMVAAGAAHMRSWSKADGTEHTRPQTRERQGAGSVDAGGDRRGVRSDVRPCGDGPR